MSTLKATKEIRNSGCYYPQRCGSREKRRSSTGYIRVDSQGWGREAKEGLARQTGVFQDTTVMKDLDCQVIEKTEP